MVLLRPKIIFGHRRVIWIKNASPRPYDVWARSFIVGAWEVIWAIWSQAHQRMEIGWGVQSLEEEKNCTASCWRGLDLSKIYMAAVLMIKVCPEVRVCGFGSSPRFGDELMEIGVAAGRSVALGKCGIGVWCGLGLRQCGVGGGLGWKLVDSLHNSTS